MSETKHFKLPIPAGYRIYLQRMEVAGLGFRKVEFSKLLNSGGVRFELEADPSNQHDPNAIKIIGVKKGLFGEKRLHIGFIPRDVAAVISEIACLPVLEVRPQAMWIGDRGGLVFEIDLLGPKADYAKFFQT